MTNPNYLVGSFTATLHYLHDAVTQRHHKDLEYYSKQAGLCVASAQDLLDAGLPDKTAGQLRELIARANKLLNQARKQLVKPI